MAIAWGDCPRLASLALGGFQETVLGETLSGETAGIVENLYIARRGFWTDRVPENAEGCDALWDIITEGAAG